MKALLSRVHREQTHDTTPADQAGMLFGPHHPATYEVVRPHGLKGLLARHEERIAALSFLAPTILAVATFIVFPVVFSFYMSLHVWDYLSPDRPFVGLDNYGTLLASSEFWNALTNTVAFAAGVVPLSLLVGLGLALLVDRPLRGIRFYRAAYFSPVVTSTVAVALIWRWLYDPMGGLLNYSLSLVGLPNLRWLDDPTWALPALILMTAWQNAGFYMVIFLAGLQGIPQEYYEAARVDGADRLRSFLQITWPLLRPTTLFALLIATIGALQVFDAVFVMTKGGPMNATETIVYLLYQRGFEYSDMGYASAIAYVLFVIIFVLTLIQWRLVGHNGEY